MLVTLYLLVTEVISVDLTAIGIMVVLVVSRILTPKEAVAGFANPAVITVGATFVVSKGMIRTGGVEFLGRKIIRFARGNPKPALLIILISVALASAFINNTPVVILFIPVVMTMCCKFDLSPSSYLIPVSYASILAGTCTLIGTSTNIIISDLSVSYGHDGLSVFELGYIGVDPKPFIVGICFGASACIATPLEYQTNLMVFGPGGYTFTDYLKLGIPLNLFVVASTLLIPRVWPF